jgi:4-hydroxy-tetrahydrodipicolinate synthase
MKPWHGVLVATAMPFDDEQAIDLDRLGEHIAWLAANGCHGVTPNGSLGEYQVLSDSERAAVVRAALEAAPDGFRVIPGVAAYGAREARAWAEQAAEAGADGVLLLPPNAYRAEPRAVVAHYAEVARAGLPIVAYNNPIDTKVDLVPELLAEIHAEGHIVAVKEFSGDVRRGWRLRELAPDLDLLVGADDVLLELMLAGAKGWIAGYPNALPALCVELYEACRAQEMERALELYGLLHPLLRWDSRTEFVQAIKLSMDLAGRYGGPCRAPRMALTDEQAATVRAATEAVLGTAVA